MTYTPTPQPLGELLPTKCDWVPPLAEAVEMARKALVTAGLVDVNTPAMAGATVRLGTALWRLVRALDAAEAALCSGAMPAAWKAEVAA